MTQSPIDAKQFQTLQHDAANGDAEAMKMLGAIYFSGKKGVAKQDFSLARKWLYKAAKAAPEDLQTLYLLGELYRKGLGGKRSLQAALPLLRRAAKGGHLKAMFALAYALAACDIQKPAPYNRAFPWVYRAANLGYRPAFFQLAEALRYGYGCQRNLNAAYYWYSRAAKEGDEQAEIQKAYCQGLGIGVQENKPGGERALQRLAQEKNTPSLWLALGAYYDTCRYPFPYRAEKALLRALKLGSGRAAFALGELARCRKNNLCEAVDYYHKGAMLGDPVCQFQTALAYLKGDADHLAPLSYKKAVHKALDYFFASATGGRPEAMVWLGKCYFLGLGFNGEHTTENTREAQQWFELAFTLFDENNTPPDLEDWRLLCDQRLQFGIHDDLDWSDLPPPEACETSDLTYHAYLDLLRNCPKQPHLLRDARQHLERLPFPQNWETLIANLNALLDIYQHYLETL